jgi:hypothetical protein
MTLPTSDQLAADVPAAIRDYIDAKLAEEAVRLGKRLALAQTNTNQTLVVVNQRLAEIDTFEKTVRGHLGL